MSLLVLARLLILKEKKINIQKKRKEKEKKRI